MRTQLLIATLAGHLAFVPTTLADHPDCVGGSGYNNGDSLFGGGLYTPGNDTGVYVSVNPRGPGQYSDGFWVAVNPDECNLPTE